MFDVLMQIYQSQGYAAQDAAVSIVKKNLFGLDIDRRAAQLSYFSVMMKARQYDRRFFSKGIQPHVYDVKESNGMTRWSEIKVKTQGKQVKLEDHFVGMADYLIDTFQDAKIYGSLLEVKPDNYDGLMDYVSQLLNNGNTDLFLNNWLQEQHDRMIPLIAQAKMLSKKYDVVVTNPPYMGSSGMNGKLSKYLKKNYPDSCSDLFAAFIERCGSMEKQNGYQAMITQQAWMFLSSYEKLREKIQQKTIVNMAHLGTRAFDEIGGEVVQTTSFVLLNQKVQNYRGTYYRLIDQKTQNDKEKLFLSGKNRYIAKQENFIKIPGNLIAYWASKKEADAFRFPALSTYMDSRRGLQTGSASNFIRKWFEVDYNKTNFNLTTESKKSLKKWFLFNSGGSFRRWYGNILDVVNWENGGKAIKSTGKAIIPSENRYFDEVVSWNKISSGKFTVRYQPCGIIPGDASPFLHSFTHNHNNLLYFMAFMNSKVSAVFMQILSPTLNFEVGNVGKLPIKNFDNINEILSLVNFNIFISQNDWDSFETSWNFSKHPLLTNHPLSLKQAYKAFKQVCIDCFQQLKHNEEELNRIFINIYGLQDELTPDESDKDVTVYRVFDTKDDIPESMKGSSYALSKQDVIKSFISYAVGCMLGRYSLDVEGLAFAGGDWDDSKYHTFLPDKDNVIPITDEDYFDDDIVGRFVQFVKAAYGADSLEENLSFIADALGNKGKSSREVIRNYFLKDFFKDHCQTYQNRPIYWLYDSGKQNGFKALIYLHRYDKNTTGKVRADYLHRMEQIYDAEKKRLQSDIDQGSSAHEISVTKKRMEKINKQIKECRDYDAKLDHLAQDQIELDLDDGVKINYRKAQTDRNGHFYEILANSKKIMAKDDLWQEYLTEWPHKKG